MKVPELRNFDLDIDYRLLEAEVATMRREKLIKQEKFLSLLTAHLIRTGLCLAATACAILGYFEKREKFASMVLACLIIMNVLMVIFCLWDLTVLKK